MRSAGPSQASRPPLGGADRRKAGGLSPQSLRSFHFVGSCDCSTRAPNDERSTSRPLHTRPVGPEPACQTGVLRQSDRWRWFMPALPTSRTPLSPSRSTPGRARPCASGCAPARRAVPHRKPWPVRAPAGTATPGFAPARSRIRPPPRALCRSSWPPRCPHDHLGGAVAGEPHIVGRTKAPVTHFHVARFGIGGTRPRLLGLGALGPWGLGAFGRLGRRQRRGDALFAFLRRRCPSIPFARVGPAPGS